jgi:c(7)-type cytochrome triheme protein
MVRRSKEGRAFGFLAGVLVLSGVLLGTISITVRVGAQTAASTEQPAAESDAKPVKKRKPSAANSFNRLLKTNAKASNAPPMSDGIHDPANSGTAVLQPPSEAFAELPKAKDGNLVDWVKALDQGLIRPWFDLEDPEAEPDILDMNIIREVKGSMPDVVYPHAQHTQWLDCSNCHDEIFVPEKGANQISMAGILLGQKCGFCHGKVAFPISDCRRCHSKPKTAEQLKALASQSTWRRKSRAQN